MATYNLQHNEVVFLKDESVMHGGALASHSDELILTSLNLVLVKKGLFGRSKGALTFPLNQVKVHDNRAQAAIGRSSSGNAALDVYFLNGQEQFSFLSGGKKKVQDWIGKINFAVTGEELPESSRTGMALPGSEMVAGVLKDTFGVFKARLGPQLAAFTKVARKCGSCGAPISGNQGQAIACEYCGSIQQL